MHRNFISLMEPGDKGDQTDAGSFQTLGEVTEAVVMRLKTKLPRIRVKGVRTAAREEERSRPR